jgi:multiple sugar transport system permease protein
MYGVITTFPFLWAVSGSFKTYQELTSGGLNLIPRQFTTHSYRQLFSQSDLFIRWIYNSFAIGIIGTFINVILNSMAGYALARVHFKGRNAIFYLLLAMIMVPAQVLIIPNYLIISSLGLLNSYTAVILPAAINVTFIFMMRQFFVNFPKSLEEAASIDGLGRLGIYFRIVFPLAKPALATQSIFIFMGFWNEFLRPKLYLRNPSQYTLTVGIQTMMAQYGPITQWDLVLTASVVSIIPIIILYIVLNKYFIQGVNINIEK